MLTPSWVRSHTLGSSVFDWSRNTDLVEVLPGNGGLRGLITSEDRLCSQFKPLDVSWLNVGVDPRVGMLVIQSGRRRTYLRGFRSAFSL